MADHLLGHIRCYDCEKNKNSKSAWLKKIQNPDVMSFLFTLSTHSEIYNFLEEHEGHKIMWMSKDGLDALGNKK